MQTSESINELAAALAKAQGDFDKLGKDKSNPHFKSQYASLASIIESTNPALVKNGISVVQCPKVAENGNVAIETMLAHSSGQYIKTELFLKPDRTNIQGIGSAITYARRYALGAILNVSAHDDDDDGNGAMPPAKPRIVAPPPKPKINMNDKFSGSNETHKQHLFGIMQKHKVPSDMMRNYFELLATQEPLVKDVEPRVIAMMKEG